MSDIWKVQPYYAHMDAMKIKPGIVIYDALNFPDFKQFCCISSEKNEYVGMTAVGGVGYKIIHN